MPIGRLLLVGAGILAASAGTIGPAQADQSYLHDYLPMHARLMVTLLTRYPTDLKTEVTFHPGGGPDIDDQNFGYRYQDETNPFDWNEAANAAELLSRQAPSVRLGEIAPSSALAYSGTSSVQDALAGQTLFGSGSDGITATGANGTIWWTNTNVGHYKEDFTFQKLQSSYADVSGGFMHPFSDNFALGFDGDYMYANTSAVGGQTIDLNRLQANGRASYLFSPTGEIAAMLGYGHDFNHNVWFGGSDDYGVDRFHFGVAIDQAFLVANDLIFDASAEWQGIVINRNTSTTSGGIVVPSSTTSSGHAVFAGKLTKTVGTTELFAEAALGLVTNDTGALNLTAKPWDGAITAGVDFDWQNMVLGVKAYAGYGQADYSRFGGSLSLKGHW